MLELIFQGFLEWAYGLALECWQYFSTALLDIMSMDFAYLKSHAPVVDEIMQILLAVGWALLIGNLVFQALKSMAVGLGFEGEDPKLLFARTFVFAFLLLASPQICEIGLSMTSKIIELLQIPDAVNVTFVDESVLVQRKAACHLPESLERHGHAGDRAGRNADACYAGRLLSAKRHAAGSTEENSKSRAAGCCESGVRRDAFGRDSDDLPLLRRRSPSCSRGKGVWYRGGKTTGLGT